MSGSMAFISFVNYMKTELASSGITVAWEKDETRTPPYLYFQDGPDRLRNTWLSSRLCQAWLVVEKGSTEPLQVTAAKTLDKVVRASTDPGHVEKYDYSTSPKSLIGTFIPKLFEVTAEMSSDPLRSKRVVTWELHSASR